MPRPLMICLALLATVVALAACGGGSETATIGTSEVTIDREPESVVDAMRAVAEQQPYEKWALDCVIGQYEKIITPKVEDELEGASEKAMGEFLLPHLEAINKACERPGRHIFNPNATEEELAVVRSSEVQGLRLILKAGGVPAGVRTCVEGELAALPGPQIIALIEADEAEREVLFEELAAPCLGGGEAG
ncbi:MAG: hypothetical protein JST53_12275 [Actinobacteria bacterium]|nr:hypothetical protein [Actinomycetota bacterium]